MYGPTDLKKNTLITLDGQPYKVVEYSQKVMGRGGSIVNVKVKLLPARCSIFTAMMKNSISWTQSLSNNMNFLLTWLAT